MLASDVTLTVYNMEDPIIGGYEPAKVALRRALDHGLEHRAGDPPRTQRPGGAGAVADRCPNTMGYDPNFKSDGYDPATARALLDLYGYVDRDGDGLREHPDGSPLIVEVSTQPDQASRRLDELQRKDFTAIGMNRVPAGQVAGESEERSHRQVHGVARRLVSRSP